MRSTKVEIFAHVNTSIRWNSVSKLHSCIFTPSNQDLKSAAWSSHVKTPNEQRCKCCLFISGASGCVSSDLHLVRTHWECIHLNTFPSVYTIPRWLRALISPEVQWAATAAGMHYIQELLTHARLKAITCAGSSPLLTLPHFLSFSELEQNYLSLLVWLCSA